ncbi:helix-turn-helix transcriptional regulator [Xylophilus ampelinus]|uniref:AlpA family transcriptional regulator n=1 Tax=Xylophilus ampelinus TaxID=54067 RepID=A0A318SCT0_9BURK|nr:AlpA family phage regulatory protein [Xylophilus ampelinus]MCS4511505.1 AlpA family phage regulatory protein [Xylophilus ampelinus]PYE74373.1 AlpA family transcriptional regulator [Xylophilus ampelinus]
MNVPTQPETPLVRERLLRLPEVEDVCGIKKSTIYALMKQIGPDGRRKFPPCIRVTRRAAAWPESAVMEWVRLRVAESTHAASAQLW